MTKYISHAPDWFELKRNVRRIFQAVDLELKRIWKKKRDLEAFLRYFKKSLWNDVQILSTRELYLIKVRFLENSKLERRGNI